MPALKSRTLVVALLVWMLSGAACGQQPAAPAGVVFQTKSQYNTIYVCERDGKRWLAFEDGAKQSEIDLKRPDRLTISYTRAIMTAFAAAPKPQRILIVGLGGGSMPMFIRRTYPELQIDIAELDDAVATVARKYFNFKEDDRMKVHIGDGRKFIETTDNRYDIIFLDAYGADSIPFSLATRQFIVAVKSKLTENGLAVSNVWSFQSNKLYYSMIKTYLDVYPELHVIQARNSLNRIFIAPAKKMELDKTKLITAAAALKEKPLQPLKLTEVIESGYEDSLKLPAEAKVLLDGEEPKP